MTWVLYTLGGPVYTCSACNLAAESFRAIDNVPNHAHLCKECARLLPEPIMAHYFRLEKRKYQA